MIQYFDSHAIWISYVPSQRNLATTVFSYFTNVMSSFTIKTEIYVTCV